jgi:hypothetical protein
MKIPLEFQQVQHWSCFARSEELNPSALSRNVKSIQCQCWVGTTSRWFLIWITWPILWPREESAVFIFTRLSIHARRIQKQHLCFFFRVMSTLICSGHDMRQLHSLIQPTSLGLFSQLYITPAMVRVSFHSKHVLRFHFCTLLVSPYWESFLVSLECMTQR